MDTYIAFIRGEANRGKEQKVFDWIKAAKIINEKSAKSASAGLAEDFEWTGDVIFSNGSPVPKEKALTYLASTWATPVLIIDGESIDCYKMQSEVPDWDAETYWPKESLELIGAQENKQ